MKKNHGYGGSSWPTNKKGMRLSWEMPTAITRTQRGGGRGGREGREKRRKMGLERTDASQTRWAPYTAQGILPWGIPARKRAFGGKRQHWLKESMQNRRADESDANKKTETSQKGKEWVGGEKTLILAV